MTVPKLYAALQVVSAATAKFSTYNCYGRERETSRVSIALGWPGNQ